jgi:multidrug efflux pump subunit AcrA (membrane-fusion protein)
MLNLASALTLAFSAACAVLIVLYLKNKREAAAALVRYSQIIDLEAEQSNLSLANSRLREEIAASRGLAEEEHARRLKRYREAEAAFLAQDQTTRATLGAEYETAVERYRELLKEVAIVEESLEDISFGIYKPHFTFQTPEEYKVEIESLRIQQRQAVREGRAVVCPTEWTVGDSKAEGKRMIRLNFKLLLRAFNGECEAAIANVSWSNAEQMEQRIRKAYADINKLGEVLHIDITGPYMRLKIEELRLTQEYEQKRYELREEQRRIRDQIREEERTQKEIETALDESASDEERFSAAIAKARDEATRAMGAKLERLTEQISKFEAKLDEARKKKERAIARAQLTKSGFVYVISNIGSFGDRIFKIGMTRRLEPMDRIYELSGASVPFPYDLHAMLYSDDAPHLEHEMHKLFQDRRLNRVNARREFFQDVALEEIERFVRAKGLSAQFVQIPEAREYRQTLAQRQEIQMATPASVTRFPDQLFAPAASTAA